MFQWNGNRFNSLVLKTKQQKVSQLPKLLKNRFLWIYFNSVSYVKVYFYAKADLH